MNLSESLDRTAARWPRKPALIEHSQAVSYAGLCELTVGLASQLREHGVSAGMRVGLYSANSINYVALTFALWRCQAVVVPIPIECSAEELKTLSSALQVEAILSQEPLGPSLALGRGGFLTHLTPAQRPDNHGLNIAFIRFTSGTTHARKGVVLSHESIRDRVTSANRALGIEPDDTIMWCLPMSHHFLISIVLYLSVGATIVLARPVPAGPFLESVDRWQATILYAAPFHYALLAGDKSQSGLGSVRLAVSTTCPLPPEVAENFRRRFHKPLAQALGIIELGLVSVNLDDPIGRWDSVGRPLADHRVRVLAPDENGLGEIAVSGPGFFEAYAIPWVPRDAALVDGWFRTGDVGRLDRDGFLFLAGRITGVINLAGRKVFPEEIEAVLNRHPAVSAARAYARAHGHLGQVVEADVVLAQSGADPGAILDFCRRRLASFKVPARLHVVRSLPRTAVTGKIRRVTELAGALGTHG